MDLHRGGTALDEADIRILAVLQQDGTIANQTLAAAVHLSPAPCLRRGSLAAASDARSSRLHRC